jgi:hydrogenase maturation protease
MKGAGHWEELERPGPDSVVVAGVELRRRSRVRLRPQRGADVFDVALEGRTAVVAELVEGIDGELQVAVTVEDDPGRDLGAARSLGHRFFFAPSEVEPLPGEATDRPARRILVAGIGNVFLGGMDLAFALADYDVVVLLDALPRGNAPGTLYLIEPEMDDHAAAIDTHGMDPVKVLALARHLGTTLPRVLVVGCEPANRLSEDDELLAELSEPVRGALGEAVRMVESLLDELATRDETTKGAP